MLSPRTLLTCAAGDGQRLLEVGNFNVWKPDLSSSQPGICPASKKSLASWFYQSINMSFYAMPTFQTGRVPHRRCPHLPWIPRWNAEEQKKNAEGDFSRITPLTSATALYVWRRCCTNWFQFLLPFFGSSQFALSDLWHHWDIFFHTAAVAHKVFFSFWDYSP